MESEKSGNPCSFEYHNERAGYMAGKEMYKKMKRQKIE